MCQVVCKDMPHDHVIFFLTMWYVFDHVLYFFKITENFHLGEMIKTILTSNQNKSKKSFRIDHHLHQF